MESGRCITTLRMIVRDTAPNKLSKVMRIIARRENELSDITIQRRRRRKIILDRNLYSAMRDDAMKKRRFFLHVSRHANTIILVIASLRIVSDNICARAFAYI